MFDFANSGYTTVVLTAVFNAYFVGVLAKGADWAALLWTATLSVSYALVIVAMPALGTWADRRAIKKPLLLGSAALCVLSTALLGMVGTDGLWLAVALVVVSNVAYSAGESLSAAFLPELARPASLGRVSGWGWSVGYVGGMLTLGLSLAVVLQGQGAGQAASEYVPYTLYITAVVFAIAVVPCALLLKERAVPDASAQSSLSAIWRRWFDDAWHAWQETRGQADFRTLLACGVLYQAGIAVVITLAAVYAEQQLGFSMAEIMALIFLVNIAAAVGAFAFGHLQDRLGHRMALIGTLWGWLLMVSLALVEGQPLWFWAAAVLAGLCMGSSQSAGRALVGALCPSGHLARHYALWTLATRIAFILGPISYGLITWLSGGQHRLGLGATSLFFIGGLVLAYRLSPQAGMTQPLPPGTLNG